MKLFLARVHLTLHISSIINILYTDSKRNRILSLRNLRVSCVHAHFTVMSQRGVNKKIYFSHCSFD